MPPFAWLETIGYTVLHGPLIAAGELHAERVDPDYRDVVLDRRILRKYGYPPDKQEKATQTVLEQAEVLSETWAVE